ncbi:hypothetical protein [endosymbiont GvMRE of Glomus versiforme]|uniref:hypothetical protein n=1 Tax=endosymbiont GvMRE of Glomus versiforme TaxID=2039283 RepID=UPI000ECE7D54|nr:hypothetical protein [endosymbiont GvMRE of Glomus versiforme]RHZ36305.1 hypothetical protein GvMRE_Ic1g102 [endosymbiont GvMRE of Glomus versiforme]
MPQIKKTKPKTARQAVKKKITKKVSTALVRAKPTKNPAAYFQCMSACCQKGIKPKKITQVAHECKTNALALNAKMSQARAKAARKIKDGYEQLGKGLSEFIRSK